LALHLRRTSLRALSAHLDALSARGPVGRGKALLGCGAHLDAFRARRPGDRDALRPLLSSVGPCARPIGALLLHLSLTIIPAMRPRLCRGCDRQCGDSRGE
jgi:hypothetical protein